MWVHATKSLPHDIENMYTLYTERTLIIGLNIFLPRSKKLWHLPPTYPLIHGIVLQDFVPHRGTRMWNMRHSVTLQVPYSWNPCMAEHVNTSQNIYHGRRDVWQQCDNKGTMRQVLQAVHFECPGTETPVSHSILELHFPLFSLLALWGNKNWPPMQYKSETNWKLLKQKGLKGLQMVQFECPRHWKPSVSFSFGIERTAFSNY